MPSKKEETSKPLIIKIIGIGGRGCNILGRLDTFSNKNIQRIAIGVKSKIFDSIDVDIKIELKEDDRLKNNDNKEKIVNDVINKSKNEIISAIKDADIVFMVGNLNSEFSVLETKSIAKIAQDNNILSFFISTLPFSFEGDRKEEMAQSSRKVLSNSVDGMIILDNNKLLNANISSLEALTKIDKTITKCISSLVDLVNDIGIINVDFNDFKSTIQKTGELFFSTARGSKDNIPKLINNLIASEFLADYELDKISKILYVIIANDNFSMSEIKEIGEKIKDELSASNQIIFGVVKDNSLKDEILVTLIAG